MIIIIHNNINDGVPRRVQVTCLYEQVTKEKDDVIGKLGLLENERRKLINELTTAEQKVREATKVSVVDPPCCIPA